MEATIDVTKRWHSSDGSRLIIPTIPGITAFSLPVFRDSLSGFPRSSSGLLEMNWSRREELNTPSTDYDSAALALSYTGLLR
jgi:hypothetical protein